MATLERICIKVEESIKDTNDIDLIDIKSLVRNIIERNHKAS